MHDVCLQLWFATRVWHPVKAARRRVRSGASRFRPGYEYVTTWKRRIVDNSAKVRTAIIARMPPSYRCSNTNNRPNIFVFRIGNCARSSPVKLPNKLKMFVFFIRSSHSWLQHSETCPLGIRVNIILFILHENLSSYFKFSDYLSE